jgi:hypothetical protein
MNQPEPEYEVGDTVYDCHGIKLGEVVHRHYNDYTKLWSYTVADSMSQYTGRFALFTPNSVKIQRW